MTGVPFVLCAGMKTLVLLLIVACAAASTSNSNTGTPSPCDGVTGTGVWTELAPMPTARQGLTSSAVDGIIYAIGGILIASVEAYDPSTNTWTEVAPMPTARYTLASSAVDANVYAIGGADGISGSELNTVEAYSPFRSLSEGTWAEVAPMPSAREYLASSAVDGIIYAIGGVWGQSLYNTVEGYEPSTNTWTEVAPMHSARSALTSSAVDGIIFAIGGIDGTNVNATPYNTVESYDPSTNRWTEVASMPTAREGLTSSAVDGIIYAIGGYSNSFYLHTVEAYDPSTNTWTEVAPMPTARSCLTSSAVDGIIYAIGGSGGDGSLNTVEAYDTSTNTWTQVASMPTACSCLASSAVAGIIVTIGTESSAYDPSANSWEPVAWIPIRFSALTSSAVDGIIFAMGGDDCVDPCPTFAYMPPPRCIQPYDATASSSALNAPPENAIDNNINTEWNAGGYAPAWIDFQIPTSTLYKLRWMDSVTPSPAAVDLEIYIGSQADDATLVFSQSYTATNGTYQEYVLGYAADISYIRFSRVEISSAFVAYNEIYPCGIMNTEDESYNLSESYFESDSYVGDDGIEEESPSSFQWWILAVLFALAGFFALVVFVGLLVWKHTHKGEPDEFANLTDTNTYSTFQME